MHDPQIRQILKNELKNQYKDVQDTIFWDEFEVQNGLARIDLAVINGSLDGYEIKSGQDSLARLVGQMRHYDLTFENLSIVIESVHLNNTIKTVPAHWGVLEIERDGYLNIVRKGTANTGITKEAVTSLLRKDEMVRMLLANNIAHRKTSNRDYYIKSIADNFRKETILNYVRSALKDRFASAS